MLKDNATFERSCDSGFFVPDLQAYGNATGLWVLRQWQDSPVPLTPDAVPKLTI